MATPVLMLTLTLAMAGEAGFNLDFGTTFGSPMTGFAGAAASHTGRYLTGHLRGGDSRKRA